MRTSATRPAASPSGSTGAEGSWTFEGEGLFVPADLNRLVSQQKVDVGMLPKVPPSGARSKAA